MSIILSTNNLSKIYINGKTKLNALYSISLKIEKGSINVIFGKSGSGKSTLLSLLGGMDFPSNGTMIFNNSDFYSLNENEKAKIRGQNFGYVFQSFNLIPEINVYDNIRLPLIINNKKLNTDYFDEIIYSLNINNKLYSFPYEISGGEQQRVAIARAIVMNPKIVFADEPTGNLDTENSSNISKILLSLNKKFSTTIILVTHEKDLIKNPDQMFFIKDGRVYENND